MNRCPSYALETELILLMLPLLSAIICRLLPQRSESLLPAVSSLLLMLSTIASVVAMTRQWNIPFTYELYWFRVAGTRITAGLLVDNVSLLMATTTNVISLGVHVFSATYMKGEKRLAAYYSNLGLFTFSMLGIALSNNLLLLFAFWEIVGFSSYLLISFWADRPAAGTAATKALLMNRIGDVALLCGIVLVGVHNSWNITELEKAGASSMLIGALVFGGVVGKSAQFPLFSWLPDAMEAPTPVSALIHAATMVAAGVFLLVRLYFLFPADLLPLISGVGFATAVIGAIGALFHTDIKRILAYSTLSQLGLMVLAVGAGAPQAGFTHLVTHGFFKALLFLAAASLAFMHQEAGVQSWGNIHDVRVSPKQNPILFLAFALGAASLIGLPLTGGFISKESIIESIQAPFLKAAVMLLSAMTTLYTMRLVVTLFSATGTGRGRIHLPISLTAPLVVMMTGCLWFIVSLNPFQLNSWITPGGTATGIGFGWWSVISVTMVIVLCALSLRWFRKQILTPAWVNGHFGFDKLYSLLVVRPLIGAAGAVRWIDARVLDEALHQIVYIKVTAALATAWIDREVVDGSARLLARGVMAGGSLFRAFVSGKIQLYILWALAGLLTFMIWLIL